MKFQGTDTYVATRDLTLAVNAAVALQRPLLIKGEPGTGKTLLAEEVARALNMPLFQWHIKSTTKAQQGLYEYDAVSRLRDSQLGDPRVEDISHYIVHGVLWRAFEYDAPSVVLIDEIDKADIEFHCYELHRTIKAKHRPLIIITSNNEKELPDAFLRRCFFHYIKFPDKGTMQRIVNVHFPALKHDLLKEALELFFDLREVPGLKKKPSTSELIDWLKLLLAEDIPPEALRAREAKDGSTFTCDPSVTTPSRCCSFSTSAVRWTTTSRPARNSSLPPAPSSSISNISTSTTASMKVSGRIIAGDTVKSCRPGMSSTPTAPTTSSSSSVTPA